MASFEIRDHDLFKITDLESSEDFCFTSIDAHSISENVQPK